MSLSTEESERDSKRLVAEMAELIGGLAHELRNPLSTMMVNLKLLAEDLEDDRPHPDDTRRRALHRVDVLQREAARLQSLFDAFLDVANPRGLTLRDTDLNGLIARLAEFFQPVAEDSGIELLVSLPDEPLVVSVDGNALRQALLNLIINARQAMPNGGTLRVDALRRASGVCVSVTDTGLGIATEDCERIFRPFFSTKAGGHGLGLAFTQRIVREHGGSLALTSTPGTGTTFTIELPDTKTADVPAPPDSG